MYQPWVESINLTITLSIVSCTRQDIRVHSEWTRWQEADKWAWDEAKRRRWAEGLWRHQRRRALARDATRRALRAAEQRQRLEVRAA